MLTPEQHARQLIDAQLQQAGWLVQDYKQVNLGAGPGIAVREYPAASGPADYALFVDRKILDVKPSLKTLEPHRLRALIEEDLRAYPDSLMADIHRRLEELSKAEIRREVYQMVADGRIMPQGKATKNRRYSLP